MTINNVPTNLSMEPMTDDESFTVSATHRVAFEILFLLCLWVMSVVTWNLLSFARPPPFQITFTMCRVPHHFWHKSNGYHSKAWPIPDNIHERGHAAWKGPIMPNSKSFSLVFVPPPPHPLPFFFSFFSHMNGFRSDRTAWTVGLLWERKRYCLRACVHACVCVCVHFWARLDCAKMAAPPRFRSHDLADHVI